MHFIVIGWDGKEENALEKRMAVRPRHLELAEEFHGNGKWLYACGIQNDAGALIGSMIVCRFDSEDQLRREWLDREPYILAGVWQEVVVKPALIPPYFLQKNER